MRRYSHMFPYVRAAAHLHVSKTPPDLGSSQMAYFAAGETTLLSLMVTLSECRRIPNV